MQLVISLTLRNATELTTNDLQHFEYILYCKVPQAKLFSMFCVESLRIIDNHSHSISIT